MPRIATFGRVATVGAASLALAGAVTVGPALAGGDGGTSDTGNSTGSGSAPKHISGSGNGSTPSRPSLRAVGLVGGTTLVTFDVERPWETRSLGQVGGLDGDTLVGIDYRVQDGLLYGVGRRGGIYAFRSGATTARKVSQLSVALNGNLFGVDFNPAANRLRVVSDTGQNLRHNIDDPKGMPAAGSTAKDGDLNIPMSPTAPADPSADGITAVAYTNNDSDPDTATTLYAIDTKLNQVSIQSPANAGTLQPTGKLTVDAATNAGFDIYSAVRAGTTVNVKSFAVLSVAGRYRLYKIALFSGKATHMGVFTREVTDIAIPLDQR